MFDSDNNDLFDIDIPDLPSTEDKLFIPSDDWRFNAIISGKFSNWYVYLSGFKTAGDVLIERISEDNSDSDFLVFPIVFCYRHFIELSLKYLIIEGNKLEKHYNHFPETHNLLVLWQVCRPVLSRIIQEDISSELNGIENLIKQFHEIDKFSFAFRYPVEKKNKMNSVKLSLDGEKHINVRNIYEIMNKYKYIIDGIFGILDAYEDDVFSL